MQLRTFYLPSLDVLRSGFGRPLDALEPVFGRPNQGRFLQPLAGAARESTAEIGWGDPIGRPPGPAGGCVTGGAASRSAESKEGKSIKSRAEQPVKWRTSNISASSISFFWGYVWRVFCAVPGPILRLELERYA